MPKLVRRRRVPALVGRQETARLLGTSSPNLLRDVPELPPPLNERGIEGFEVSATPLWPREEVCQLAAIRAEAKRAGR